MISRPLSLSQITDCCALQGEDHQKSTITSRLVTSVIVAAESYDFSEPGWIPTRQLPKGCAAIWRKVCPFLPGKVDSRSDSMDGHVVTWHRVGPYLTLSRRSWATPGHVGVCGCSVWVLLTVAKERPIRSGIIDKLVFLILKIKC
jgi:hypothetical protein